MSPRMRGYTRRDQQKNPGGADISIVIFICEMRHSCTHPISLLLIGIRLCSQFLDTKKEPHTVTDFVYSHLLKHSLVHLQQVLSINVVLPKQLLILGTVHAP